MEKIIEKKEINKSDNPQDLVFDGQRLLNTISKHVDVNKTLYDMLIESGDIIEDENGNIIKNNFV